MWGLSAYHRIVVVVGMHTAALEHRKLSTAIAQRVGRRTSNKVLRWALYVTQNLMVGTSVYMSRECPQRISNF